MGIDDNVNKRVAVVGKLVPGSRERAAEIISKGAPYELALAGFRRHSVFLAEETVVFVFEGRAIEGLVRGLVNDPARSAAFSIWAPLLEGLLCLPGRSSTGRRASKDDAKPGMKVAPTSSLPEPLNKEVLGV
jgi:hypothetical protein